VHVNGNVCADVHVHVLVDVHDDVDVRVAEKRTCPADPKVHPARSPLRRFQYRLPLRKPGCPVLRSLS